MIYGRVDDIREGMRCVGGEVIYLSNEKGSNQCFYPLSGSLSDNFF